MKKRSKEMRVAVYMRVGNREQLSESSLPQKYESDKSRGGK